MCNCDGGDDGEELNFLTSSGEGNHSDDPGIEYGSVFPVVVWADTEGGIFAHSDDGTDTGTLVS